MIGLSTYAYAWRRHPENPHPFTVLDVLDDAVRMDVGLVQLCDLPELEQADDVWLREIGAAAVDRGLQLETGTRGIEPEHLEAHLWKARSLGAELVRSMVSSQRATPTVTVAINQLRAVMPLYESASVQVALETYEQYSSGDLARIVEEVDSPNLGVCLDPGNSVARLETPSEVVRNTANHVRNIHIKDFAFTRKEGMIGFTFAGTELGRGLLDYPAMVSAVAVANPTRRINQVIEHWLTRQETLADLSLIHI